MHLTLIARVCCFLCFFCSGISMLYGQKDTEFWFVAPESVQGGVDYDRPVVFRISAHEQAATITLSQPANPSFIPQVIFVEAESSGTIYLDDVFEWLENYPENKVLNKGLFIQATAPVTVYYEILSGCTCNPEIFVLKGRKALGHEFYVPFQTLADNGVIYDPDPKAAIDIVATENNTTIFIKPTKPFIGHSAGVEFSVHLQRGETYSLVCPDVSASKRPTGTHISSDKPIAVTVKDDLAGGDPYIPGLFYDMLGDQLVPVDYIGMKYVLQRGELYVGEKAFIIGTRPNTEVSLDGSLISTIHAGQALTINITDLHYVEATEPIYVMKLTGIGYELATTIVPPFECNGSSEVRFIRSSDKEFYLLLITTAGAQSFFTLNGASGPIKASMFKPVPGTNGTLVAAKIENLNIAPEISTVVSNSKGLFQMSFLDGDPLQGARYGYFSDFGRNQIIQTERSVCEGDTIQFGGQVISEAGVYADTVFSSQSCDTILQLSVGIIPAPPKSFLGRDTFICAGENLILESPYEQTLWNGFFTGISFPVEHPGIITAQIIDENVCTRSDTIAIYTCCAETGVFFPDIFSPNGDGVNDEYCVHTRSECQVVKWQIFDRWGNELFYSEDSRSCWDGNFHNRKMLPGVYAWYAEIREAGSETTTRRSGDFALIR